LPARREVGVEQVLRDCFRAGEVVAVAVEYRDRGVAMNGERAFRVSAGRNHCEAARARNGRQLAQ